MNRISFSSLLVCILFFFGCIGEDIVNDEVDPEVRILNPVNSISVSEMYQFNATFFNNVGQPEPVSISWSSSNESVAAINNNGLINAISEGQTTIKAIVSYNSTTIETDTAITVITGTVDQSLDTKSGTIISTSGYELTGDFTLKMIENTNNLQLTLGSSYKASSSLPGLYVYLTNNPNTVANAYEIGPVTIFEGSHTYTIPNVGINDYSYLLYWCKPFGVKVGGGDINN